jgi:arabinofuranosyltransferase
MVTTGTTHPPAPPRRPVGATQRYRTALAYVLAGIILLGYGWHCHVVDYVVDDSFITFRYVHNFISGHGIVYNPGERVEGYTNFLWLLILSAVAWAAPGVDLLRAAQLLGVMCGGATILLVILCSWRLRQRIDSSGLIAAAFLAFSSAFCAWSTGGLETTLFALLVFAGSYAYVAALERNGRPVAAPLAFALAALTRPEGVLLFGVVSGHLLWTEVRSRGRVFTTRLALWTLLFATLYIPYYVWRYAYYGYPFPNTFYAKVGGGWHEYVRGIHYLLDYLRWNGVLVFALPLVLLVKRRRARLLNVLFMEVATYVAYIVYVGGDGLAFFRFVACIAPLIYILVQEGFCESYELAMRYVWPAHWRTGAMQAAFGLVLGVSLCWTASQTLGAVFFPRSERWYEPQAELSFPGTGTDHHYLWFDNYFVDRLALAARWLQEHAPPDAVVASTPAGSIGYHMNLRVIDMLGLNDVHIAHVRSDGLGTGRAGHEKGDGKYVLARSPDYILLGNVAVLPRPLSEEEMAKKLVQRSEHEIWADPDFHRRYERGTVQLSRDGIFHYFTFYRKKPVSDQ